MTSASELFYTRRSRSGRTSLDIGFDSSLDRTFHHHGNSQRRHHHHHHQHHNTPRRERHDFDACDPPRRTPVTRHHSHRPSNSDRDTVRPDGSRFEPGGSNIMNVDNSGGLRGSMRPSGNDRLPGAVILARERLLQRLRGVSLSGNRFEKQIWPCFGLFPSVSKCPIVCSVAAIYSGAYRLRVMLDSNSYFPWFRMTPNPTQTLTEF